MTIEMQFVQSSNIEQIGYDEPNQELHVNFLNSNIVYIYIAVPEYVYEEFLAADSKGRYLHQNIKPRFEFRKE